MMSSKEALSLKGALVGLGSGLVMAFWVGIGSIVTRTSGGPVAVSQFNCTTLRNITSAMGTALISTATPTATPSRPMGLQRFYSLSFMWYSTLNSFTVVIIGLIISFLTGPMKAEEVTPGTLYPLLGNMLYFVPDKLKQKLCCVTPLGHRPTIQESPPAQHESNGQVVYTDGQAVYTDGQAVYTDGQAVYTDGQAAYTEEDSVEEEEGQSFLLSHHTPVVERETTL